MKTIRIITLLIISSSLHSQDTISNKKKNFLVANCDYLYNEYIGNRTVEFYPGATVTEYTSFTAKNTSGLLASFACRHYFANQSSIQLGVGFRYKMHSYLHNDSLVNSNNIALEKHELFYSSIEVPIYYGLHFKRFSLLTGVVIPIVTLRSAIDYFEDGSKLKYNKGSEWGELYISERLQFTILKKQNIGISIGGDFSSDFFKKYTNAYLINWNVGAIWMIERKKKVKEDDYVQ